MKYKLVPPKIVDPSLRNHTPYHISQSPSFEDVNMPMTVEKISSSVTVNNDLISVENIGDDEQDFYDVIKQNIINQMTDQIAKCMELYKSCNAMNGTTEFTGTINITNKKCEKIIVSDRQFITDGQTFTLGDLEKAVKNQFPERFI